MSNQSYDQRVKDILDRVAKGHLSTEEATTLIAAITTPGTAQADEPAAQPPVAEDVVLVGPGSLGRERTHRAQTRVGSDDHRPPDPAPECAYISFLPFRDECV